MIDWEEHRRRMIDEVSAFVTWGLAHPDEVRPIPRKRLGEGGFSRTMQGLYWRQALGTIDIARKDILRRFLRWAHIG